MVYRLTSESSHRLMSRVSKDCEEPRHHYFDQGVQFHRYSSQTSPESGNGSRVTDRRLADLATFWGARMSVKPKLQRDQAAQGPERPPLDFGAGRPIYTGRVRRRRNHRYRLIATLLILGVATGVVALLLADWLSTLIK